MAGSGQRDTRELLNRASCGEAQAGQLLLDRLAHTLPKGKLLYISDTKLDAPKNLLAIAARKGQFLCGGVLMPNLQHRYLGLRNRLSPVDYFPES
jgi:hypothetical protein